jgi:hypothetical protein
MDSLIAAAARALVVGDTLGALKRVSLRDDPPALALRGIAMAQLGEHSRARELLRRAARGFGAHEELARARCVVAEAEVALAMRDLRGSPRALTAAAATLEARADRANALQARLIAVRRRPARRLDEAAAAGSPRYARCATGAAGGGTSGYGACAARCAQQRQGPPSPTPTRRPSTRTSLHCLPRWRRRAPRPSPAAQRPCRATLLCPTS